MKILMSIAHGSRKPGANDEVKHLAADIQQLVVNREFYAMLPSFPEFADPDIQPGIVEMGADCIVAVPYFLAAGRHVAEDIPEQLAMARLAHLQISKEQSQYLGESDEMEELILRCSAQINQDASLADLPRRPISPSIAVPNNQKAAGSGTSERRLILMSP